MVNNDPIIRKLQQDMADIKERFGNLDRRLQEYQEATSRDSWELRKAIFELAKQITESVDEIKKKATID